MLNGILFKLNQKRNCKYTRKEMNNLTASRLPNHCVLEVTTSSLEYDLWFYVVSLLNSSLISGHTVQFCVLLMEPKPTRSPHNDSNCTDDDEAHFS